MRTRRFLQAALTVCVMVAVAACGGEDSNSPQPGASPSGSPTVGSPVPSSVGSPPAGSPPSSGPNRPAPPGGPATPATPADPALFGAVELRTVTEQGVAVPSVPVYMTRHEPCDPASRDLAEDAALVQRWDGSTGADGRITFAAPVGCYRVGMNPPPGTNPVPVGMHTLFLETGGQVVTGSLLFEDPASAPICASETIVRDLGLGEPFSSAAATVSECNGSWAVIVWDMPGDSQRIVRQMDSRWSTYVVFPHELCWSSAQSDGAPNALEGYFSAC